MLRQLLIRLDRYRLILVALLPVRLRGGIIRNQNRRYATEEFIHVDMCRDPGTFFLVDESFNEGVLAIGHHADKDPRLCVFASIRINNLGRISHPVNFDLFAGPSWKMHCGVALLFVLLDVIAKLGIHKWIITCSLAVFKVFRPKEFLVDTVAEKFLSDVIIIRQTLRT